MKNGRVADDTMRGKRLSALEVFNQFVTVSSTGEVDVTKVLSKACFQRWLTTRVGEVKHPQETFYRTFVAHLRAKGGRKPFHPDVEAKLLAKLRDTETNVWQDCFEGPSKWQVGKYGFKQLGFHESVRKTVHSNACYEARYSKNENNRLMAEHRLIAESFASLQGLEDFIPDDVDLEIQPASGELYIPWNALCTLLEDLNDQGHTINLNSSPCPYCQRVVFSPALLYLLQLPVDMNIAKFNYDLIFPTELDADFKNTPGDYCILGDNDVVVADGSNMFYASNLAIGQCYHTLISSFYEFWYAHIRLLPMMIEGKIVYKRATFRKADGNLGLFITRTKASKTMGKSPITEYQEILDPVLISKLLKPGLV